LFTSEKPTESSGVHRETGFFNVEEYIYLAIYPSYLFWKKALSVIMGKHVKFELPTTF
jgi:hypothetical protein